MTTALHPLYTGGRREYLIAYALTTASGPLGLAATALFCLAVSTPRASDALGIGALAMFVAAAGSLVVGRTLRRRAWQWVAGNVRLTDPAWMRRTALAVDLASTLTLPAVVSGTDVGAGGQLLLGSALFMSMGFVASRRITAFVPWVARLVALALAGSLLLPGAGAGAETTFWLPFTLVVTGAVLAFIFRLLRGRASAFLG